MSVELLTKVKDFSTAPQEVDLKSLFQAALAADWRQAFVARGYGWHFDAGAFSTPIVGGGNGTVIDLDQPEFGVSVPAGYAIVPLRISVQCQPPLIAADNDEIEILIAADRAAAYAGDGTVTAETPVNLRTNSTGGSSATCFSAATVDITDPTLGMELARAVKAADVQGTAANAKFDELSLVYEPAVPPILIGPCAIYGYWGGTVATSGFAQVQFLVIPSALVINLA